MPTLSADSAKEAVIIRGDMSGLWLVEERITGGNTPPPPNATGDATVAEENEDRAPRPPPRPPDSVDSAVAPARHAPARACR